MTQIQVVRSEDLSPERLDEIRALLMAAFDDGFDDDDWNHTLGGWHVLANGQGAGGARRGRRADARG